MATVSSCRRWAKLQPSVAGCGVQAFMNSARGRTRFRCRSFFAWAAGCRCAAISAMRCRHLLRILDRDGEQRFAYDHDEDPRTGFLELDRSGHRRLGLPEAQKGGLTGANIQYAYRWGSSWSCPIFFVALR